MVQAVQLLENPVREAVRRRPDSLRAGRGLFLASSVANTEELSSFAILNL